MQDEFKIPVSGDTWVMKDKSINAGTCTIICIAIASHTYQNMVVYRYDGEPVNQNGFWVSELMNFVDRFELVKK